MHKKNQTCSECGGRILIRLNPFSNPRSKHAHKGGPVSLGKGHDLCKICWLALVVKFNTVA